MLCTLRTKAFRKKLLGDKAPLFFVLVAVKPRVANNMRGSSTKIWLIFTAILLSLSVNGKTFLVR
jgi:hypothetical protein